MQILKKEKFLLLMLLALCGIFFFFKLGSYHLIDVDEPRYAEAAREMFSSGNWITPYFNYELRFDKPVFFYWLIAISYIFFGITEFAARFPSALLATLTVLCTYFYGRTFISKSFGFISSVVLITMLEFVAMSRMSITDMTLSFFICATIFSGVLADYFYREQPKKNKSILLWWLAYIFCALAVLTKGPVGFALPAAIFGIYFLLKGRLKDNLRFVYVIPGLILFSIIALPWYYLMIKIHGDSFVDYFFLKHNLERFASTGFKQHSQPFYFYIPVVLAGIFPWTTYFVASLIKNTKKIIVFIKEKPFKIAGKFNLAVFKDSDEKTNVILLSLVWFVVILIFFSSSRAKLITYILPLFPACAILTGLYLHEYLTEDKNKCGMMISAATFFFISLLLAIILIVSFNSILPRDEKLVIAMSNYLLAGFLTVISAVILFFVKRGKKVLALCSNVILMALVSIIAITTIMPAVYNSGQKDLIEFIQIYKSTSLKDSKLYTFALVKPSIIFYSREKVLRIKNKNYVTLAKTLLTKTPVFIIVKNKDAGKIPKNIKYNLVRKGVRYSFISNKNLTTQKDDKEKINK
jgi:4-amino-4-deoxy-L-arabinose transferase-like glycosyltransferase